MNKKGKRTRHGGPTLKSFEQHFRDFGCVRRFEVGVIVNISSVVKE